MQSSKSKFPGLFVGASFAVLAPVMPGTCGGSGGTGAGGTAGAPSGTCGNGWLELGEDCDGPSSGACKDYSAGLFGAGTYQCGTDCKFDVSGCAPARCGDGIKSRTEYCDGSDMSYLVDPTCGAYDPSRFVGGTLSCGADCNFDTSQCTRSTCGDGVRAAAEECDGADFDLRPYADWWDPDPTLCATHSALFASGQVRCTSECRVDFSQCRSVTCGDGLVEGFEECEAGKLNGQTCATYQPRSFRGGALSCKNDCNFDTSACVSWCGNGVVDYDEVCDGQALAGKSCADMIVADGRYYLGGTLRCSSQCGFDFSQCIKPPGCEILVMDRWYQWHCLF
jgi:hypothetical protein